jgi:hypothetical protein
LGAQENSSLGPKYEEYQTIISIVSLFWGVIMETSREMTFSHLLHVLVVQYKNEHSPSTNASNVFIDQQQRALCL